MSEGDAVKVCVRVRPLIQREQGDQANLQWKAGNNTISQVDGTKSFNFDRVFNSHESTSQIYQEIAVPIIRSALQGYNGTIFAYGQTSSGKTYTMMGTPNSLGIIPQAIQEVFKIIQEIPNREFLLRVSYMEIYNETVKDLLCDDRRKKPLEIREDFNRNVYVADLTEELVMVPEHVIQWIKKGEKNRHYGETKMNDHSSRSHTIFRMIVESRDRNDPTNSENCDGAVMVSHLNLVDLAGSERASQTGAEGVRLKEGCNINRSLFILGQVIKKLSDGQAGGFINYRDSKLTRILQNSLGGNAKTVIICTITPVSFDETLSTLQFASTAKHVRNTPHVNEVLDDEALLKRYRKEILDLKKQLENLESSSETKAQAMAKEEHTQLLAEIKQLHKEREDRIWHLTNIVVASSQESQQDQRVKRKRRVTWAPGKIQNSLHASGVSDFDMLSRLPGNFSKKAKFSDMPSFPEIDDSVCTEFSDFDDALSMMDSNGIDAEWNLASKVTHREKTSLHQSMIDFGQISDSVQFHDSSKENQLQYLPKDSGDMAECRKASFEKEITSLQQQLQSKEEEKKELVQSFELKIAELEEQLSVKAKNLEMVTNSREHSINAEVQTDVEKEVVRKEMSVLGDSGYNASNSDLQDSSVDGKRLSSSHDECIEHRKMLEQKIVDLEEFIENLNKKSENDKQKSSEQDFMESIQLCEAIMAEKANALEELALMRDNFDNIILENETLKREIADLERSLKENQETNEFEILEKETQKEHEAQLIHEIGSLKKLVENAEMYNQNLEEDLETKTKLLKEQEIQLAELRKRADNLQKKVRNFDLSVSMGDSEKLCEEIFQLKQSLSDAEAVTRDAQKECSFLRSENLELKEKMEDTSNWYNQKEKAASLFEKQLETEKSNYKKMEADLQKELQSAFNEINYLNGLLAGKVPRDLLSRVELEKKVSEFSKQLEKALEEKNALENEVTCLSEYKFLPNEVECLKNQISKASEEIMLLKQEGEHSASIISKQEIIMQEQSEQILQLTDEVTHTQSKVQQTEEQYLEMKKMHDDLFEKYIRNKSEAEDLLREMENLKGTMESVEVKIADTKHELEETIRDKEQLLHEKKYFFQAMQTIFPITPLSDSLPPSKLVEGNSQDPIEINDYHNLIALATERNNIMVCLETERNSLKEQVIDLNTQLQSLQAQSIEKSDLQKPKQDLEEGEVKLLLEMELLKGHLTDSQLSIEKLQLENLEVTEKLQTLQEEMKNITIERNELQTNFEDLKAEHDSLKQDLSENIEQSIETQDELRAAQEELREQKQLVDSFRQQLLDCSVGISSPNHDAVANQEKVSLGEVNSLQSEMLRGERDELQTSCKALVSELELLRAHVKSVEGENLEITKKLNGLEKEILGKSEESEVLKSMLENLKEDNNKLKEQAEEYSSKENQFSLEEVFSGSQKLVDEIEVLKAQLKAAEERLEIKDRDYFELVQTANTNLVEGKLETPLQADHEEDSIDRRSEEMEIKVLGEKLERNQYLLERLQEEKLELSNKLEILQKEMETSVLLKDDLQQKLESLLSENIILKENIDTTLKHHSDTQAQLQKTQQELQLAKNLAIAASDNCPITQEKETSADCVHPLEEKILLLTEELHQKTNEQEKLLHEKNELEQAQVELKCEVEHLMKSMIESKSSLESLQHEKHDTEQQLLALKQQMQVVTQEKKELQQTHEHLTAEVDHLKENIELGLNFKNEAQQKTTKEQCLLNENKELEQSQHRLQCEIEELMKSLKDKESALETLKESEQKVINLNQEMEMVMLEMEELKNSQRTVIAERDQLQDDLRESVEMSIETQDDLRKAQEALQQQKDKVQELTSQISVLQEKISLLENQMLYNVATVKETLSERDDLNQSKQHLFSEIETLSLSLKEKEFALEQAEKDKADAARKTIDITEKISNIEEQLLQQATNLKETLYERESLIQCKEQLALNTEHLRETLKSKDLALGKMEQERDEAANKVIALTEKMSSLEEQINENVTTLKEGEGEKETFYLQRPSKQQSSSQMEELRESLKTKDLQLEEAEKEISEATNEIKNLTAKISSLEEEILQNASILNEAVSERENLRHSKQQLVSELEQLSLTLKSRDHAFAQSKREKDEAVNKIASLAEEIKILTKEMDEFRDSKESLQEQSSHLSEELCTYKTELQMLKQQKEDINNKLAEKVKEVDELLQHLSSLKEQLDQIQMELRNEKLRNYELCEKMDIMEKEISVLRLMQNEPQQEEDDVAERMDILESRNQEIQELMEKISAVYSEQHTLLSSLSSELQKETEAHKHCMLNIKESLSSTLSRSFGSLQTEHVKLNTQLQTLLNKFKVVYRTAAVKEDHSLIKDYEKDLAAEQKRHDELRLQLQCLEQHGRKWSDSASEELKFCEIEFLNELLFKKANIIQSVQDDFSEVQVFLNQVGSTLQEELEHKKGFMQWLEEFGDLHVDAKKLSEGMQQENRRIASTIQLLTKRLKAVVQSKIQREITVYLNQFEAKLQEKKEQNKELMRRMEHHGPSASVMEEENARLLGILKTVQDESKKLQSRIKMLENELNLVKDDAMHKGEKVAILQDKLLSRNAEAELNAMQVKLTKKQDNLQAAMKEIENLQKMVAKGAVPYKEEIDNLKTKVVKIEMEKIKYSKATDQEIAYLKSCLEDKEEGLRRLKEELRRAQADNDTTVCVPKDYQKASTFPVTCGGGSGIVQSTAMLVLQSEKAALERELSHYKKKYHHLSRTMSSSEDRKKTKAKSDAHSSHTGSSHRGSPHKTETYRHGPVTPERSEMPSLHLGSPKKSESSTKRVVSPNRSEIYSQLVMSPGKTGMHKHILSPSKVGLHKKRALSPNRSEMPTQHVISPGKTGLHKNLTESTLFDNLSSPCKQQKVQENLNSPKGKLFDVKSKSMPYCPSQFFDNSKLGDFSELNTAESNDKSQAENWWYEAKKETAPECKTS
uniref:Centromere-associated protein E n=1 Tax=Xenopus laevis TaxID=8355 RepID=O42263_XENLA|nr:centromere protein E S homeolog [Xenopus laevis]AAC60300.1 kinesin-related protein [Xenopus laevis]